MEISIKKYRFQRINQKPPVNSTHSSVSNVALPPPTALRQNSPLNMPLVHTAALAAPLVAPIAVVQEGFSGRVIPEADIKNAMLNASELVKRIQNKLKVNMITVSDFKRVLFSRVYY